MTVRASKSSFAVREKLSQLFKNVGKKGKELLSSETTKDAHLALNLPSGKKNMLDNGDFRVNQRSTALTASGSNAKQFGLDRWGVFNYPSTNAGVFTWTQIGATHADTPPGHAAYGRAEVTTAQTSLASNTFNVIQQTIEGNNLTALKAGSAQARPSVVSFWARSNIPGTYSAGLQLNTKFIFKTFEITKTDQWQKITLKFPPFTNVVTGAIAGTGAAAYLNIVLAMGSSYVGPESSEGIITTNNDYGYDQNVNFMAQVGATFDLAGTQWEVGEEATDFEFIGYQEELANCQRYFYRALPFSAKPAWIYATNAASTLLEFPVQMRANPTFSYNGTLNTNILVYYGAVSGYITLTSISGTTASPQSMRINFGTSTSLTAGHAAGFYVSTNAYLDFFAEI